MHRMSHSNNAWVTCALAEDQVPKALILAASLRSVNGAQQSFARLVVIVGKGLLSSSSSSSSPLGDKLEKAFDLVVSLDKDEEEEEEEELEWCPALIHAFSLVQFEKIVFLSSNMVVVSNCDGIFEKGQSIFRDSNGVFDPSVMLVYPSTKFHEVLQKTIKKSTERKGDWRNQLGQALQSNLPRLGSLEEMYNTKVDLFGSQVESSGNHDLAVAIGNFAKGHPWELWESSGVDCQNNGFGDFDEIIFDKLASLAVGLITGATRKVGGGECIGGIMEQKRRPNLSNGPSNEPIAIVGLSFRLPGGNTEDEFWNLLIEGRDAIRRVPPGRWTKEHSMLHYNDESGVEAGFLDVPIDEFDAKFFGTNPKDAVVLDPQIRLLHEVSWEALEQGGIDPSSLRGSQTGIFVGSWMLNYQDLVSKSSSLEQNMFRVYMGNSIGAESARLSHFFGTTGPAISTESGCSSAIVALHLGVKSLRNRECNMALACGVNLLIHPFTFKMMEGVMAPDYRCKTFDAKADGFARAEGVVVLVMKRLSDAVRDGDSIWGLIRGSAVVQEGHSKSLGTPTVHCEALAMELALRDAGVDGGEVSYVEAHGTGTAVGDPMEVAAITRAYKSSQGGRRAEPLMIGSVKTNVGHTESVSGLTGIIKVLLSMKHELIPPHLHLNTLNPELDLEACPISIPVQAVEWPRRPTGGRRRIAGVSSFGITGTDGHAIIQEPPPPPPLLPQSKTRRSCCSELKRPLHCLKLSAKSPESFETLLQKYEELLESGEDQALADICYSANTGRASFPHRAVILAKDAADASRILKEKTFDKAEVGGDGGAGGGGGSLCFLFTGQGSQYPGMARSLYDSSPTFQMHFDRAAELLERSYSIGIKEAMWEPTTTTTTTGGSALLLSRTLYSQTSIFVVEYCLLKLWESWGVRPDYVMGHSLGEFAAAVASGAVTFEDALMLVAERSRLIDSLPRGKMLVVKANKATVEHTIATYTQSHPDFWADFAALNSHDQTVIAGDSEMIEEFGKFCEEKKLKCVMLASTHAFHSRHMDPILEEYGKIASTIRGPSPPPGAPLPKYISGMQGKVVDVDSLDANYWVEHTRQQVSFMEACKAAGSEACSLFLEIGPHPVLSALTMMNMEGTSSVITCLPSLRRNSEDCWSVLLDSLSKLYLSNWRGSIDWKGFDRDYSRKRVPLPLYPFHKKSVWVEIRPQLPLLHPLLGRVLPTATSHFIYESGMSSKSAPYLQDHVIGNTVIFPGAGFLEMCLAAGYASAQGLKSELPKPRRAIALKGLKIGAPLALQESHASILQTTVNLEEEALGGVEDNGGGDGGYPVTISKFCSDDGPRHQEWTTLATARFHPVLFKSSSSSSSSSGGILPKLEQSLEEIQETWEKMDTFDFYGKLPEVGLRFGPTFQSLETSWRGGKGGALFKVKVPEDYDSYLVHPVVADGMLQALMVWSSWAAAAAAAAGRSQLKRKLQVPVSIGEFLLLERTGWCCSSDELYIYCTTSSPEGKPVCQLLTGEGNPLASMTDVEFVETNSKLVESVALQQSSFIGTTWEEIYRPCPGPLQNSLPPVDINWEEALSPQLQAEVVRLAENSLEEQEFHRSTATTTRYFLLSALYRLGWDPQAGLKFTTEELMHSLGICASFQRYVTFLLRDLAANSILDMEVTGTTTTTTTEEDQQDYQCTFWVSSPTNSEPPQLPSPSQVEEYLSAPTPPPSTLATQEFRLVTEIGKSLAGILSGRVEPLPILFSESPGKPNATQFYTERGLKMEPALMKINHEIVVPAMTSKASESTKATVRFLEIGSGTGAASRLFLELLAGTGLPFEYFFTDISSAFFIGAEKEFGGKQYGKGVVTFKKYNMEEDPLEQGFSPGYFDFILAVEVLHIAKDVRATLRRVRSLLKPGGIFEIVESVKPDVILTFMFGLLEGYWGFQDLDFRRWHITLTTPMWEEALTLADFADVRYFPGYLDVQGMIICRGGGGGAEVDVLREVGEQPKHGWILFDDGTSLTGSLRGRLEKLNRTVSVFQKPPGLGSMGESDFKGALSDFIRRTTTSSEGLKLEGILYLWGLTEEADDQTLISLPFVTLCQLVTSEGLTPSVYVVTQGVIPASGSQVLHPAAATLYGIVKSMNNENQAVRFSGIDLSPDLPPASQVDFILGNLWAEQMDIWLSRGGEEGLRLHPRMAASKQQRSWSSDYLLLPNGCDRFQLVLPPTRLIPDLEFAFLDHYILGEGEIEMEVKAVGLNFRDVMVVLKPVPEFESFNAVGLDLAGVVSRVGPGVVEPKVGARIIGTPQDESLTMPSHLKLSAARAIPLPPSMTFAEGATLPTVFATAYYCLVRVADMKAGETILIHTASGGVGLCAVQLAKRLGVEVIATAGSNRKRTYLRNLGIAHVFNSRNTEYGAQILEVTEGRGVDIVLNSLTGPGFKEESLRALRPNGRFVEMSKMSVWSVEEVAGMRPDVSYTIADISSLDEAEYAGIREMLHQEVTAGKSLEPIPYERFDALNIRGALNHLQKGKHVGKVVCIMPELKAAGKGEKYHERTPMFNPDSAYLVTGGLGGIGFELVKWILRSGGKHVAIASRSPPKPEMAAKIDALNRGGAHVVAFPVDIGKFEQCQQLFEAIRKGFPPLRGVMHAAGVLADATIENQSWASFRSTYNPKVEGTRHLHQLTKSLLLEHFLLFSSASAVLGSPGQTNHSAANCFEDAFAHHRRSIGLPATTINWANWGEVGVATEVDFPGLSPISTAQGIAVLEGVLRTQTTQTVVINIESFSLIIKVFPRLKTYLDDKRLFGEVVRLTIVNSDEFWAEVDSAEGREEKMVIFKKHIIIVTRNTLHLEADEVIDESAEFSSIGVDSLMMLEMKNALQALVGSRLTITAAQVKDCTSPSLLAARLVDLLEGQEEERNLPSLEELREMIKEDCILPDHIAAVDPTTLPPSKSIDQVSTVLLTGATGNLGPFLLLELSRTPQITKIYCLIRKGGKLSPSERLRSALAKAGISEEQVDLEVAGSKVECLQGDISLQSFGMPQEEYNTLAEAVDAVFHCAVLADHTAKYWKSPDAKKNSCSRVRSTNVGGTLRVLEFCVKGRPKHLFHASSLLAINTLDESGMAEQGWQTNDAFSTITTNSAYSISKFVSEQLVKTAGERGLVAVTVLRLPLITGERRSGTVDFKASHLHLQFLAMLKLGCMPEVPAILPHIPVDTCAALCAQVALHPEAYGQVFNVHPRFVEVIQVLATVAQQEFGIQMDFVSHSEFFGRLRAEPAGSPLDPFKELYDDQEKLVEDVDFYRSFLQMYVSGEPEADYGCGKISKIVPDFEERMEPLSAFLRRDLKYMKAQGAFDKFGIKG